MIKPLCDAHKRLEKVHINRLKICRLPYLIQDEDTDTEPEISPNNIEEANNENVSENSDSDSEEEINYAPRNIVNVRSDRNVPNISGNNYYNLRSKGSVTDNSRLPNRPLEYRSRNIIGILIALIIMIKLICCC